MSADLTAKLKRKIQAWDRRHTTLAADETICEVRRLLEAGDTEKAAETARLYEWGKAMDIVDQLWTQLIACRAWPLPDNATDPSAALAALETVLDDNNALAFAQSPEGREGVAPEDRTVQHACRDRMTL